MDCINKKFSKNKVIYNGTKAENVKIAYIGGGSRGWAWGLMTDLAKAEDMSGYVYLYDIDFDAAKANEVIGNGLKESDECKSVWEYKAVKTIGEALADATFVVISILPGTFDEMESDVHAPEKYGIYQPVGDTTGPGGIVRALRTIPMIQEIARAVEEYCPDAWVINYTNPMAMCVKTLYETFPKIKAFGCCHEVFGTQSLLKAALEKLCDIKDAKREDININVLGVNHFTWITRAQYKNIDLIKLYREFIDFSRESNFEVGSDDNWINKHYISGQKVKFDLFDRYGYIAAAGDRHLSEFCPREWYLKDPKKVEDFGFELTTVKWRKEDLKERLEKSRKLLSGEEKFEFKETGEEGVNQMRAILGLGKLITNVNMPNMGQIPNLPIGAVVETNACFRSDCVEPMFAGKIPDNIYPLIVRNVSEQLEVVKGAIDRNLNRVYNAFVNDQLVSIDLDDAKELFDKMIDNTKGYLKDYKI